MTRQHLIACAALVGSLTAADARAQVTVDRQVSSVYGQVVTQSDVFQALELKLLPAGTSTFEAAQREIERRLLVLREADRAEPAVVGAEAVATLRRVWEASVGREASVALLTRAEMSEAVLDKWFRDTITIETYLRRRFGNLADADQGAAIANWIRLLRDRAGLPSLPVSGP